MMLSMEGRAGSGLCGTIELFLGDPVPGKEFFEPGPHRSFSLIPTPRSVTPLSALHTIVFATLH